MPTVRTIVPLRILPDEQWNLTVLRELCLCQPSTMCHRCCESLSAKLMDCKKYDGVAVIKLAGTLSGPSPLSRSVKTGDVIVAINGQRCRSWQVARDLLQSATGNAELHMVADRRRPATRSLVNNVRAKVGVSISAFTPVSVLSKFKSNRGRASRTMRETTAATVVQAAVRGWQTRVRTDKLRQIQSILQSQAQRAADRMAVARRTAAATHIQEALYRRWRRRGRACDSLPTAGSWVSDGSGESYSRRTKRAQNRSPFGSATWLAERQARLQTLTPASFPLSRSPSMESTNSMESERVTQVDSSRLLDGTSPRAGATLPSAPSTFHKRNVHTKKAGVLFSSEFIQYLWEETDAILSSPCTCGARRPKAQSSATWFTWF